MSKIRERVKISQNHIFSKHITISSNSIDDDDECWRQNLLVTVIFLGLTLGFW